MKPHPKLRKTIKWGGAAMSLVLLALWIASVWCYGVYFFHDSTAVFVGFGRVGYGGPSVGSTRNPFIDHFIYLPTEGTFNWSIQLPTRGDPYMYIPLWLPLSLTLIPTVIAWRLDTLARRRARAGACPKCHYDRAGLLAEAVCPECGAAAPPAREARL